MVCARTDCPPWASGVDIDPEVLRIGEEIAGRMDLRNAAAEHLPYGNSEFDLVISRVSLPYTDLPKAAREMRRVLRTGGRIWLALHDFRMFKRQWTGSRTWRERLFMSYVAANSALLHLTLHTFSCFGRRESWQTESSILRILKRCGFHAVRVEPGCCLVVTARG